MTSFEPESALFDPSDNKTFRIRLETRDQREAPFYLALYFVDEHQRQVMIVDSHHSRETLTPGDPVELCVVLASPWLCPGEYRVDAYLYNPDLIDIWEDACRFAVSSRIPCTGSIFEPVISGSIVLPDFSISKRVLVDSEQLGEGHRT